MTREEYVNTFGDDAIAATRYSPMFASVLMAQAILESADDDGVPGNSVPACAGKNHFGSIADPRWKGGRLTHPVCAVIDGKEQKTDAEFRVYARDRDSFVDRVKLLYKIKQYRKAGVFRTSSADRQANAFQAAGYSTDPGYAEKLIALMKNYDLYKLNRFHDSDQWGLAAMAAGS